MRHIARVVGLVAAAAVLSPAFVSAQQPETIVSKCAISVHRVERGRMTLREAASGVILPLTRALGGGRVVHGGGRLPTNSE